MREVVAVHDVISFNMIISIKLVLTRSKWEFNSAKCMIDRWVVEEDTTPMDFHCSHSHLDVFQSSLKNFVLFSNFTYHHKLDESYVPKHFIFRNWMLFPLTKTLFSFLCSCVVTKLTKHDVPLKIYFWAVSIHYSSSLNQYSAYYLEILYT